MSDDTHPGADFEDALRYALIAHGAHKRKGTKIPYIAHLLSVSALVLEAEGSEVQAIAALLHDAAEDCGGQPRLDDVRHRFGDEVGDIVEACSDSLVESAAEKAPWSERKITYVEHLSQFPADVLLVSLADKLHNVTAILRDLRTFGDDVFLRFTVGRAEGALAGRKATEWYYTELIKVFDARRAELTPGGIVLLEELRLTLQAIEVHRSTSSAALPG
ncbi:MAG: HD domain-containing protein [Actinomycetota bacterium]|nr:HD domain-containing protein [Actinomycetota bacterium]